MNRVESGCPVRVSGGPAPGALSQAALTSQGLGFAAPLLKECWLTSPTQISTHGELTSPRGCRGAFGSIGTAEATRIEADLTGTDCQIATFTAEVS